MSGVFLAIDASTYRGSVALVRGNGMVVRESDVVMRGAHEERLMPAVAALIGEAGINVCELAGVVCGAGPGSFTSLRIAASIAKGIAVGGGIPLYSISSLLLIPASAPESLAAGKYLAMLDAMRGDFFTLICSVTADGRIAASNGAVMEMIPLAEIERVTNAHLPAVVQIGPGRTRDVAPHARGVARFIGDSSAIIPVDAATWEPHYGRLAEAEVRLEAAREKSG